MIKLKRIKEEDLTHIYDWWEQWPKWTPLPRTHLPDNGLGGLIVYNNDEPVVAGFMYNTNSSMVLVEWIISNPEYRDKNRKECIQTLITGFEEMAKAMGKKSVFSIGRHKGLMNTHKELGWHIDDDPSYEMIKNI